MSTTSTGYTLALFVRPAHAEYLEHCNLAAEDNAVGRKTFSTREEAQAAGEAWQAAKDKGFGRGWVFKVREFASRFETT